MNTSALEPQPRLRPWQRLVIRLALRAALALVCSAVLATVFLLYLQPEFMVSMADHIWACF